MSDESVTVTITKEQAIELFRSGLSYADFLDMWNELLSAAGLPRDNEFPY